MLGGFPYGGGEYGGGPPSFFIRTVTIVRKATDKIVMTTTRIVAGLTTAIRASTLTTDAEAAKLTSTSRTSTLTTNNTNPTIL